MSNYTTQTATLKATTIDTRKIDANQIDTKKLFINGELFDPSQIKESPNVALFSLMVEPHDERIGFWVFESMKLIDPDGFERVLSIGGQLIKGSQTEGLLPNGVYVPIQIDDNFAKCIGGNSLNDTNILYMYMIPSAKILLINYEDGSGSIIEQCILQNFFTIPDEGGFNWFIKIYEEDDNSSELYGGITEEIPYFMFLVSIPYYILENDTSTSTYSLRRTNPFDSLREKFEQMRQQILDNSTE